MSVLEVLNVSIKNFYSVKSLEVTLIPGTVTVLAGDNGAGKSTIMEAIRWCLYGIARSNNKSVVSFWAQKQQDTEVRTLVNTPSGKFTIVRRVKGSPVVKVFDSSENEITHAESKTLIVDLLNKESFTSLCYNQGSGFLKHSNIEKRNILNNLYGLSEFENYSKIAKAEATRIKNKLEQLNLQVVQTDATIASVDKNLLQLQDHQDTWKKERNEVLKKREERKITEEELEEMIQQFANEKATASNQLKLLKEIRTGNCPVCGNPPDDVAVKRLKKEKPKIQELYKEMDQGYKQVRILLKEIRDEEKTLKGSPYEELIEENKKLIKQQKAELKKLKNQLAEVEKQHILSQYWVKGTNVTGLPALMVGKILNLISSVANFWIDDTEMQIQMFAQTELVSGGTRERISVQINGCGLYENLSKGEQKRVDLAILYALKMTAIHKSNLLCLDETLDSLDEKRIPFALDLITRIAKETNTAILLASHNFNIKEERVTIWDVSKKDGCTQVVRYNAS